MSDVLTGPEGSYGEFQLFMRPASTLVESFERLTRFKSITKFKTLALPQVNEGILLYGFSANLNLYDDFLHESITTVRSRVKLRGPYAHC